MSQPKFPDALIPTRQSLLSRLKDWDDSDSWREFFDTYWRLIYAVAVKAGLTDSEAQEAVQETIIAVSKKIPEFRYDPSIGSFKGWLLHMARWRINDQFRRRGREARHVVVPMEDAFHLAEHVADPAGLDLNSVWNEEWQSAVLDAAIQRVKEQVNPKQYQIFDLYAVKKWPLQKVAATLGVRRGQVYLVKHRISLILAKEIKALENKLF